MEADMWRWIRQNFICSHDRTESRSDVAHERDMSRLTTSIRCLDCGWSHQSVTDARDGAAQTVRQ